MAPNVEYSQNYIKPNDFAEISKYGLIFNFLLILIKHFAEDKYFELLKEKFEGIWSPSRVLIGVCINVVHSLGPPDFSETIPSQKPVLSYSRQKNLGTPMDC